MNAGVAGLLSLAGVIVGYVITGAFRRRLDAKTLALVRPQNIHNIVAPSTIELTPPPCPRCGEPCHPVSTPIEPGDTSWEWGHDCEDPRV